MFAKIAKIVNSLDTIIDKVAADPQKFVRETAVGIITDDEVQATVEKLVGKVVTTYVTPIIPAAVGAAVDKAFANIRTLADFNDDGKVNVEDASKAVHDTFDQLLPPFLKPFLPKWN